MTSTSSLRHHSIDALVVVRELANGDWVAFPAADPGLVSYGTETSCREELRLFLGEHLAELPAFELQRFAFPDDAELAEVEVVIPRDGLPRRLRKLPPIAVPCLVIPSGRAAWVVALPLRHTFFADDAAAWRDRARDEIARIAAARETTAAEYLDLLPGLGQRLERLRVEVQRDAEEKAGGRGAARDRTQQKRDARRLLAEIGRPLSRSGPTELVERDEPLRILRALLDGRQRLSVVVTGRELVGKTALIETALRGRAHVYVTSGAQLMAGQSFFGQWQQRVHDVMKAAEVLDAVLCFDNLADVLAAQRPGAGDGDREDIAGLMRPYLERRRVRVVAEASPELAEQAALAHVGFFSQLHPLMLEPLDADATRRVLASRVARHRRRHPDSPGLASDAVAPLVELAERYLPYHAFPGKAVRLYEELLAVHAHDRDDDGEPRTLTASDVFEAVSLRTGIPSFLLRDDRALKFEEIVRTFGRRIIGQREAVERVAATLCTVKAGLQPAGRPLAVFLFVGPTGVGKTEVARTLARFLFGSPDRLLRFDMSEYMDPWAAERLIRGTDREEGLLTRRIRQQPFSVLLLDEIEKADSAVFDLLLQVMSDGRLTDAKGRTAYFHNAILIMTSNLGAAHRREPPGFAGDGAGVSSQRYYEEQVERHFRPELVNRLDRVVAFEALTADEVRAIARVAVDRLAARHGLSERGIRLDVAPEVLAHLALEAHDPAYGARQLHRHLDRHLVAPLARLLARLGTKAESSTVEVRRQGEGTPPGEAVEKEGELLFVVRRHVRGKPRTALREIEEIARLRRRVHALLGGERPQELREELEMLTTRLAASRRKKKDSLPGAEIARLQTEHHRLSQIWERLAGFQEEIDDAEEVAIHALFDGEPVEPFREQVDDLYRRWRAALPYALVAREPQRDEITLVVTERDLWRGLDLWLTPLFEHASGRGWTLSGHLYPDPAADKAKRRWGPARNAKALAEMLAVPERKWRRVLLRVKGPYAGIFLATEAGYHRWRQAPDCEDDYLHLEIERLAWRSRLKKADLDQAATLLAPLPSSVGPVRLVRAYDFQTRSLVIAGRPLRLELPHGDYWPRFDEIVCEHLLIYEDDQGRDRDEELLSARLE